MEDEKILEFKVGFSCGETTSRLQEAWIIHRRLLQGTLDEYREDQMSWLAVVASKIHAINSCSKGLKMKEKTRGVISFTSCFSEKNKDPSYIRYSKICLTEGHFSKCNFTQINLSNPVISNKLYAFIYERRRTTAYTLHSVLWIDGYTRPKDTAPFKSIHIPWTSRCNQNF